MKYLTFKNKIEQFPVFSSGLISSLVEDTDTLKVQLADWKKKGLVTQPRKGLYLLGKEYRKIEPSLFYLANQMYIPSYVSLESALRFYGLIPEFVAQTTSVTPRNTSKFQNEFGDFSYQHLKPKCFSGFTALKDENNLNILIASPEKAVVDFLYFNLSRFNSLEHDIFEESYRFQNCDGLNKNKIKLFAKSFHSIKLSIICDLFIKEVIK